MISYCRQELDHTHTGLSVKFLTHNFVDWFKETSVLKNLRPDKIPHPVSLFPLKGFHMYRPTLARTQTGTHTWAHSVGLPTGTEGKRQTLSVPSKEKAKEID